MSLEGGVGPQDRPATEGTAPSGDGAVTAGTGAAAGLSWAAATWTTPLVPGVAGALLLRLGLSAGDVPPLLLLATIVIVAAAVGVSMLVLGRQRVPRGVGVGLVAGAAASMVVGLGVIR